MTEEAINQPCTGGRDSQGQSNPIILRSTFTAKSVVDINISRYIYPFIYCFIWGNGYLNANMLPNDL